MISKKENLLDISRFIVSDYGQTQLPHVQIVQFPLSSHSQQYLGLFIPPPVINFCSFLPNFCAFLSTGFFLFMILIF